MHPSVQRFVALLACTVAFGCTSLAAEQDRSGGPYVPTPQAVVDEMLKLAGVGADDFVIDLGSGDGRIVLTAAARYRARGMGVELDGGLVEQSNAQARRQKVDRHVRFVRQDALQTSLKGATVVTMYLLPELMHKLRDRIYSERRPGSRVVSHDFSFVDWQHDRIVELSLQEKFQSPGAWQSNVFLWIVPAKVDGRWRAAIAGAGRESFIFSFRQHFQRFEGEAINATERIALQDGRLEGARIRFRMTQAASGGGMVREFTGTVDGDLIRGDVVSGSGKMSWSANRIRAQGTQ